MTLGVLPERAETLALYDSVGWAAYTQQPDVLMSALAGSTTVVTARDGRGGLVGLARVISDGVSIAYLQDVLVHPDHHRRGLGAALVDAAFEPHRSVRQNVLMTDTEARQAAFYESLGFTEMHAADVRGYVRFR
nr:GNAT family N-acetyltransferase [Helcobacillus sp. ACRRO]